MSRLLGVTAAGEHCVLATKSDDSTAQSGKYGLILCNTIGTPVDSKLSKIIICHYADKRFLAKFIEVEPLCSAMNPTHVIAASKSEFFVWNFRTPKSRSLDFGNSSF